MDVSVIAAIVAVVALIPLAVVMSRANEIVCLRVSRARLFVRRGRIPKQVLAELGDVVERARLQHGTVRIVVEGGRPRVLTSSDVADVHAQRMRNVVGMYQLAQLRNVPRR